MLNDKYEKEGFGLEIYNNGDIYLGKFKSDLRKE